MGSRRGCSGASDVDDAPTEQLKRRTIRRESVGEDTLLLVGYEAAVSTILAQRERRAVSAKPDQRHRPS